MSSVRVVACIVAIAMMSTANALANKAENDTNVLCVVLAVELKDYTTGRPDYGDDDPGLQMIALRAANIAKFHSEKIGAKKKSGQLDGVELEAAFGKYAKQFSTSFKVFKGDPKALFYRSEKDYEKYNCFPNR